jgi:transposase-like protein
MDKTVWGMGALYYTGTPWCRQRGAMNNEVGVIAGIGGVHVDHATINRWVVKYSPQLEEAFHGRRRLV